jgi:phosphoribosylformylglycinamidine (FGAM) synthase PurS component
VKGFGERSSPMENDKLLANPVIESYRVEVLPAP